MIAREMKDIAELELDAARQLADAEARRFETGLSDFFLAKSARASRCAGKTETLASGF